MSPFIAKRDIPTLPASLSMYRRIVNLGDYWYRRNRDACLRL